MSEFLKSIFEASRERLKSPILGAYTISFILINWRPIIFLSFSKATIEDKIIVVDREYSDWGTLLYPLLATFVITICVPYLMLLVDKVLVRPQKDRKKMRHDEKVVALDNEIDIATKEFEIQNRKSGTKTVELLQETISILEKEKQSIIASSNTERENNLNEINNLRSVLNTEVEKNRKAYRSDIIEFSEPVFETHNYLNSTNKLDEFYTSFDGFSDFVSIDNEKISFYKNLRLIEESTLGYSYSKLGYEFYHFLFELNVSMKVKKTISRILDMLNEHEINIIKKLPSNDFKSFNIKEDFRFAILKELLEEKLIEEIPNGEYTMTKEGLAMRNLLALNRLH